MNRPLPLIPLTQQQVALLKKSFRQLNPPLVAQRFYASLFKKHPEVKKLFPADMEDLGAKLMSVFELVVFSFEEKKHDQFALQDALIVPLRQLGRMHEEKGVDSKHYPVANALLLEAMRETAPGIFTEEVAQAWKLALSQLTESMLNKNIDPSPKGDAGLSLRETFSYIRKRLLRRPD